MPIASGMEIPAISSAQTVDDHTPRREGSLWRRFVAVLPKRGKSRSEEPPDEAATRPGRREGVGDNFDIYA